MIAKKQAVRETGAGSVQLLDYTRFRSGNNLTEFVCFALRGLVEELEMVHREVLDEVTWIAFQDYVREQLLFSGKLRTKAGERMFRLLQHLREPAALRAIRDGSAPTSLLYAGLSSKTLSRDIDYLSREKLIRISGGSIRANLELMREFMP